MSSILQSTPVKASLQPRASAALLCVLFGFMVTTSILTAGPNDRYWDINGTTAGAGGANPSGYWSTSDNNWANNNSSGTASTTAWTNDRNAIFSASTDATGTYTVTVSGGTIQVNDITVEEGSLNVIAQTVSDKVNLKNGATIDVASGSTFTFTDAITADKDFNKSGAGTLAFGSAQAFTDKIVVSGGTLSMTGTSSIKRLDITANSVLDFAGTSNLSVDQLNISSGVVLTLQNYAGSDTFNATTFKVNGTTITAGTTTTSIVISGSPGVGVVYGSGGAIGIVPEPATYGALFMASTLGGFFWTRRPRRSAA